MGGTASVLGGGKFANGAQTAAIQYLFNQAVSDEEEKPTAKSYAESNGEGWVDEHGNVYPPDPNFHNPEPGLKGVYPESLIPVVKGTQALTVIGKSVGKYLFGKGGKLNSNRYLRIGVGRGVGGRKVFRISGKLIPKSINDGHIDLKDLGPWK